ncbi:SURF1 family protein [Methylomonas sp. EFPC3]|uniref:SURF1 family protein n=1 Tax=Methylomonas sp. EFPC3 TaxID=3021710 RepID=UPI002418007C|nr:SURF1 family protein [Methylomonas sp. EFPC3]WFP50784.1 SURF1 family protein [Methylomonas sp. EFPC3]
MVRFKFFGVEFQFAWPMLAGYLLLVGLLCNLGFWQLRRGAEKQNLLDAQQAALSAPALDLNGDVLIDVAEYRYRPATLNGHYDHAHQILLDNQVLDGKAGYLVLTPFLPGNGQAAVLINRGWIGMGVSRDTAPDLSVVGQIGAVTGRINRFPEPGIRLQGAEVPGDSWPVRVQVIDTRLLAEKMGYALADYQIELSPDQPAGYRREWKTAVTIPPEKHRAYAVQWFGLALTLTVLFVWHSSRNTHRG